MSPRPTTLLFFCFLPLLASASPAAEMFLAVGPGGKRRFSTDGVHWEKHIARGSLGEHGGSPSTAAKK